MGRVRQESFLTWFETQMITPVCQWANKRVQDNQYK